MSWGSKKEELERRGGGGSRVGGGGVGERERAKRMCDETSGFC